MNRFNLEFNGEILPGRDPEITRARFGELMGIEDSARLDQCFSGDTVTLLSNLDRKSAAEHFASLRKIGVVSQLVKMTTQQAAAALSPVDDFVGSTTRKRERARKAAKQVQAERESSATTQRQRAENAAAQRQAKKQQRRKDNLAARKKTEREQAARQAAEWQRIADQKASRELQELEAAVRRAAEDKHREQQAAARLNAEQLESERKAAEEKRHHEEQARGEAARLEAQKQEAERKAAEEKRQSEEEARREAAQRQQREADAAKRKAAEKKRLKAEQAAKHKAEEAARLEAQKQEAERKAAEEKRQHEEQARREAAQRQQREADAAKRKAAEKKRLKAEQAAKRKAAQDQARQEIAQEKSRKAEEAARLKAERKETERKVAEEKRQREQKARLEAAEKKRQKAEAATQRAATEKRQKAERAAKLKAERDELKRKAQETKRHQAEQAEQGIAQRKAMDEAAIGRAAQELTRQPSLKPVEARVKTRLEVPKAATATSHPADRAGSVKPGQPGAANFYALRPFRNTPEVQSRAARAGERARRYMIWAGIALAILLASGGFRLNSPPPQQISGASAMTVTPGSGPLLLVADRLLFHDRAGVALGSVELASMGLSELTGPLLFTPDGELLAPGRIAPAQGSNKNTVLLRCKLLQRQCQPAFGGEAQPPTDAFAMHPISGALLSASAAQGRLFMTGVDGEPVVDIEAPVAESPIMRLDSGLLLMNSASGSAISVLRYDDKAFGQQLDEILLLPPPAVAKGQTQLRDFVQVAQTWWVILQAPGDGGAGIYRFDQRWNYLDQVETPTGSVPMELVSWGEKVLVRYQARASISRFSANGRQEADFSPDQLDTLIEEQQRSATLQALAWGWGVSVLALAALCWLALAGLNHMRKLVYRSHRSHGAQPVDELTGEIRWVAPVPERYGRIRRNARIYVAVAMLCLCLAIAGGVTVTQLTALLLALSGPALALWLLLRSPVGHLGIVDEQLLLADHNGMYHFGGNARLQYRSRFLLIDDVLLFTGSALFPAFNPGQITDEVMPLAHKGIRVDRKTVLVKLLQQRHPLATGACVIAAGLALAAVLLAAPLL